MSYAAYGRGWSRAGLSARGYVAAMAFLVSWALIGLMGGLWGVLLGWLPATIIANICAWAWPPPFPFSPRGPLWRSASS